MTRSVFGRLLATGRTWSWASASPASCPGAASMGRPWSPPCGSTAASSWTGESRHTTSRARACRVFTAHLQSCCCCSERPYVSWLTCVSCACLEALNAPIAACQGPWSSIVTNHLWLRCNRTDAQSPAGRVTVGVKASPNGGKDAKAENFGAAPCPHHALCDQRLLGLRACLVSKPPWT